MTRADRSLIRQCILDAAQRCVAEERTVLTRDVRDALRERARDAELPEVRGAPGCWRWPTPWTCSARAWTARCSTGPARPGPRPTSPSWTLAPSPARATNAQPPSPTSASSTRNNIAERDQFLGRPIINVTDEGHHHQEPAARALRGQDHQDVAQTRRLVLAGDAEHRRPAQGRRAHAQHDRVVDLPVDAAGRGGEIAPSAS